MEPGPAGEPRGPRRGGIGERLRGGLIEAAADLLAARPEASMAEIADAAGVGRATLYRYFPSRELLLQALCLAAIDELTRRLDEAGLDGVPVPEAIARAVRAFLAVGSRYVFLIHERLLPEHELAEKVVLSRVLSLLARGQAEGALRADVRVEWLGTCFGGLVHSAIENADLHGLGVEGAAAVVTDQFLHGAAVQG